MALHLVTGSSGFLGRALVRRLLAAGDGVLAVDIAPDAALLGSPGYRFLPADLAALRPPADARPRTVIHLAQSPRYREFPAGAEDLFRVNVEGAFRALECARAVGAERVVIASTGSVYTGSGTDGAPLTEESSTGVTEFYAASKLAAEAFARAYAPLFDLAVIRPFALYGPGQRGMLIPSLASRILAGRAVTLEGDGEGMVFSPLFVDDAARILAALIARPARRDAFRIYNLGGAEPVTIRRAALELSAALRRDARFERADRAPRHLVADSSRVYADAGCVPAVPFGEGIALTARELLESSAEPPDAGAREGACRR